MNKLLFLYCDRCRRKWKLPATEPKCFSECSICDDKASCWAEYVDNVPDPTGILFREGRPDETES